MIGWLIYDAVGVERNTWFINSLIAEAGKRDVELILKIYPKDFSCGEALPNFVIVRTINPDINLYFESKNIPVFNNYKTSAVANSKWKTYETAKKLQLSVMPTRRLSTLDEGRQISYPAVLKSVDGHGGAEVFLVANRGEYEEKIKSINKDNYILQELCDSPGIDMRVYVLGDEILSAILRKSESDFRSNFSLGGSVSVAQVTDEQKEVIERLQKELEFDFVGIDFIFNNNTWVLNEIEDVVGCRMLYKCTDIDAAAVYIRHILKKMLKK